jgi:hypothetical protein
MQTEYEHYEMVCVNIIVTQTPVAPTTGKVRDN